MGKLYSCTCCFLFVAIPSFSLYFFYHLVLTCNKFNEDGDSAALLAHVCSSLGFLIFGAIIFFFNLRYTIKHGFNRRDEYDSGGRHRVRMATLDMIEEREAAAHAEARDFDKSNRIRASLALSAACFICCAPDSGLMWAAVFGSFVIVDFNWFHEMRAQC